MRPDVKLGMAISLVVVLVTGGYYVYRDTQTEPISLGGKRLADADHGQKPKPVRANANRKISPRVRASEKPTVAHRSARDDRTKTTVAQTKVGKNSRRPGAARRTHAEKPALEKRGEATPVASERNGKLAGKTAKTPSGDTAKRGPRMESGKVVGKTKKPRSHPNRGDGRANVTASRSSRNRPAPTAPATPASSDTAVETHLVQSGDTFSSLALTYYGHEKYTQLLIDSNPHIEDPNRIRIGSRIKIPPARQAEKPRVARRKAARTAPTGGDTTGQRTYRVRRGDSFYAIASEVLADASRWEELLALNKDIVSGDPKKLQVGQVLVLPDP